MILIFKLFQIIYFELRIIIRFLEGLKQAE